MGKIDSPLLSSCDVEPENVFCFWETVFVKGRSKPEILNKFRQNMQHEASCFASFCFFFVFYVISLVKNLIG